MSTPGVEISSCSSSENPPPRRRASRRRGKRRRENCSSGIADDDGNASTTVPLVPNFRAGTLWCAVTDRHYSLLLLGQLPQRRLQAGCDEPSKAVVLGYSSPHDTEKKEATLRQLLDGVFDVRWFYVLPESVVLVETTPNPVPIVHWLLRRKQFVDVAVDCVAWASAVPCLAMEGSWLPVAKSPFAKQLTPLWWEQTGRSFHRMSPDGESLKPQPLNGQFDFHSIVQMNDSVAVGILNSQQSVALFQNQEQWTCTAAVNSTDNTTFDCLCCVDSSMGPRIIVSSTVRGSHHTVFWIHLVGSSVLRTSTTYVGKHTKYTALSDAEGTSAGGAWAGGRNGSLSLVDTRSPTPSIMFSPRALEAASGIHQVEELVTDNRALLVGCADRSIHSFDTRCLGRGPVVCLRDASPSTFEFTTRMFSQVPNDRRVIFAPLHVKQCSSFDLCDLLGFTTPIPCSAQQNFADLLNDDVDLCQAELGKQLLWRTPRGGRRLESFELLL